MILRAYFYLILSNINFNSELDLCVPFRAKAIAWEKESMTGLYA